MKWIRLLVFLVASRVAANFLNQSESQNPDSKDLTVAVNQIIHKIIVARYPTVNFIYAVDDSIRQYSQSIVTEILMANCGKAVFLLTDYSKIEESLSTPIQASVVLLDSIGSFRKFNKKVNSKAFVFRGHFLFLLVNAKKSEHDEIFSTFWEKHIYNVDLIYDDGRVETFLPFRKSSACGDTRPVLVNYFVNGEFQNGIDSVFPEKLSNLQNCSIRFVTFADTFSVRKVNSSDGSYELFGYDIEMMTALASSLNFHIQLKFLESVPVPWGILIIGRVSPKTSLTNFCFKALCTPTEQCPMHSAKSITKGLMS